MKLKSCFFSKKENLFFLALATLTTILFFYLFDIKGIFLPAFYHGDTLYFLQMIKNVTLFYTPFFGELSAPFPPELSLFPGVTLPWILLINLISIFCKDIFFINNVFVIVACCLHALTFYIAVRLLGVRRSLAFLGALTFCFLPFGIYRSFVHQVLIPLIAVPIGGYLSLLCFYQPSISVSGSAPRIINLSKFSLLVACALVGISGHYWVGFTCIFIISASLIMALSNRSLSPLLFGGYLTISILIFFVISQIPSLVAAWQTSVPMPPSPRGYTDQVYYGLRITDLFFPLNSDNTYLNNVIEFYKSVRFPNYSDPSLGEIEGRDSYLGLTGLIGFLFGVLLYIGSNKVFCNQFNLTQNHLKYRYRLITGSALLSIIAILFSVTNGFGNIFHLFVTTALRAQNRISIFLSFFSIFILLLIFENVLRKFKSSLVTSIIFFLLTITTAFSIYLQTDFLSLGQNSTWLTPIVARDYTFFTKFTEKLGNDRQILQLPIMEFPGSPPVNDFHDYEHFRGSIFTDGNRWSYGTMMARPAVLWQSKLASLPAVDMIAHARAAGFDVLFLERRGYNDKGKQLVGSLIEVLGSKAVVLDEEDRVVFDLCRHRGERQIPVIYEDRYRGFSFLQGGPNGITLRWNDTVDGHAKFALENYDKVSRPVRIEGSIVTGHNEPFTLYIKGLGADFEQRMLNNQNFNLELSVPPGINLYEIWTDAKQLVIASDPRKLFFSLWDFKVVDHKFETAIAQYRNFGNECFR